MLKIGKNISNLRQRADMTQMELADKLGISFQAVSNWERGKSMPDISKLSELSTIFGVSIDEILMSDAGRVIEKLSRDENAELTASELAQVAPVLKPKQAARAAKETADEIDLPTLAAMAAFLPDEVVDALALKAIRKGGVKVSELVQAAPFMSEDAVSECAKAVAQDGDLSVIVPLAPFMDDADVGKYARMALRNGGDLSILKELAPFMDEDDTGACAKSILENGGDLSALIELAPFMDDDDIGACAKSILKNGGDPGGITALAPFMDEDMVDECIDAKQDDIAIASAAGLLPFMSEKQASRLARHAIKKKDMQALKILMPFIDPDEI